MRYIVLLLVLWPAWAFGLSAGPPPEGQWRCEIAGTYECRWYPAKEILICKMYEDDGLPLDWLEVDFDADPAVVRIAGRGEAKPSELLKGRATTDFFATEWKLLLWGDFVEAGVLLLDPDEGHFKLTLPDLQREYFFYGTCTRINPEEPQTSDTKSQSSPTEVAPAEE